MKLSDAPGKGFDEPWQHKTPAIHQDGSGHYGYPLQPGPTQADYAVQSLQFLRAATGANFEVEHMQKTPERFFKMLQELTTPKEFEFTVFDNVKHLDEMVASYHIPFYTLCAHHVIPFYGVAHVGYVPDNCIAGLSKLGRTVQKFARALTVQEDLTVEVADFLEEKLQPKGVAVVMEAEHLCMAMRGAQLPGVVTRTSAMRGVFADHDRTAKAEFMAGINASH